LVAAIRAVKQGERFISPTVARRIDLPELIEKGKGSGKDSDRLTPREREVLQVIAEGLSTKDIADKLFISIKTVESHRAHIMQKLGLRSVAALTRYAIRKGIVRHDA
jgi:DNA-binding NarL/FixJ family response regulator